MRYFFDISGEEADREGTEFVDPIAVEKAALRLLLEVALDKPQISRYDLTLDVRGQSGDCVYRARLRLGGIWMSSAGFADEV